ncbi:16S rRNA (guanine(966)-N(2))-methyltransferase RsmD [Rhodalgimonas zhirmunskyi]|uniref:16S rRNA (Guanine(966)-N(2))-methyltransferase RsmD n=1 Tax=Rhodalgimonas zhirmunskyi TaxID=2964767 RepID=A0AAJ1U9I1_9RHOB|nr:16S rRNA (guanine(966)-N(2))-methyltransferase RsmD [Rhodoalgimonas zhirmunskyi]MDQ2095791.1 16S rRNA (guanine(966)-N(2))-methyltransferase RsmD [Rhodoalgimonas zhirmunskyi]
MRIVGGEYRGRALAALGKGDPGAHLRPTTDRTRESLFNILGGGRFGDPIPGARVLDLFAGTGALGLEALSRGADHCTFVDDGTKSTALIRRNIEICGAAAKTRLIRRDARKLPENPDAPYTLIFLDPPYGKGLGEKAMAHALNSGWIAPGALIVWEENTAITPPPGVILLDARRYGDTTISLLELEPR